MKLTHARIATNDVPGLVQFYQKITEISSVGSEDYVEFQSSVGTLAICSQRTVDLYNARATTPAANRSAIMNSKSMMRTESERDSKERSLNSFWSR